MVLEFSGLPSVTVIFGVISIVLGIIVMTQPKLAPYLLGIYLIVYGIWTIIKGF